MMLIFIIMYFNFLFNNFFFLGIIFYIFFITLFIFIRVNAIADQSDGATNTNESNNDSSDGINSIWVLLIDGIFIIAVSTIVKVVAISIIIDQQEGGRIISASIEVVWCSIVNV